MSAASSSESWIIDACRTPRGIGKVGKGSLADMHPQRLASTPLKALAERNGLDTKEVDDVIWGTSTQSGTQGGDIGRMALLDAGWDITTSGVTLDRFCGSGITATNFAAAVTASGMENMVVAGGTEMMSATPTQNFNPSGAMHRGNLHLDELHPQAHQGVCADAIATLEGISRQALDELSCESQRRAEIAIQQGRFDKSLVPVHDDDGNVLLDREEYPRPTTTMEGLANLKPAFAAWLDAPMGGVEGAPTYGEQIQKRYPGLEIEAVHHAGSSSGVVDGAAALLLANSGYAQAQGLTPRARVVAMANMGDDPTLMLNAPVPAAKKALEKAGLTKDDIDLWEINEAFAVVSEKFQRDLDLDRSKVNVNGAAIALGHPIGATGAVLIGTILDELERSDKQFGLVTMCAAGGMAPAIIIERI